MFYSIIFIIKLYSLFLKNVIKRYLIVLENNNSMPKEETNFMFERDGNNVN